LAFLFEEAELLDKGHFAEWLDLMAEDVTYRLPIRVTKARESGSDSSDETAIYSDTLASLRLRVQRLGTGYAWAETPPSRTCHLVSNVRVRPTDDPSEYEVSSYFLVHRNRLDESNADIFCGE